MLVWLNDHVRAALDLRLFDLGDRPVTISTVIIVVLVVMASFWFSSFVQRRAASELSRRGIDEEGAVAVGLRFSHYAIVVMGLGIGLQTAGVDLSALFAAGAVFAVAIGFAMQTVAQNFVSGVILLLEGAIKPGDILEINGRMVRVSRMGIRATIVRTTDDAEEIVPNGILVGAGVINYTLSDKLIRVRIPVGVAYGADPHQTQAALRAAAMGYPGRHPDRDPVVQLTGFGSSSVDWDVSVWIEDPWLLPHARTGLALAVWDGLAAEKLTIAFPQVDVHFDADVVRRLGAA